METSLSPGFQFNHVASFEVCESSYQINKYELLKNILVSSSLKVTCTENADRESNLGFR